MNTDQVEFLTTDEVAMRLRLEESAVRKMCAAGVFPNATQPGRKWLIPPGDVDAYIEAGRLSKPADKPTT